MITIHKIFSNLPILIILNSAFCYFFLMENKFYINNFETLSILDSILSIISLFHFFFFDKYYDKFRKIFVLCIVAMSQLSTLLFFVDYEIYKTIYLIIITTCLCLCLTKKWID